MLKQQQNIMNHITYHVNLSEGLDEKLIKQVFDRGWTNILAAVKNIFHIYTIGCNGLLNNQSALEEMKKSDIILVTSSFFCGAMVAEHYEKPFIVIHPTSFTGFAPFAMTPIPSSYVPAVRSQLTDKMSFMERVKSYLISRLRNLLLRLTIPLLFNSIQRQYNVTPPKNLFDMVGKAEMHIVQLDFALEFNHPLMPSKCRFGSTNLRPQS